MSLTYETNVLAQELEEFLLSEHALGTGIPVHPFSVVNATMTMFNRTLGITNSDDTGTLFVADNEMTAYGCGTNNYDDMLKALRGCGVEIKFWW